MEKEIIQHIPENPGQQIEEAKSNTLPRKKGVMNFLDFTQLVSAEAIIKQLPFILFLATLAIIYIANAHYAEKTTKSIYQIEKDLTELRWNFMSTEADLENLSKQSAVAKLVDPQGLKELTTPPIKIVIDGSQH